MRGQVYDKKKTLPRFIWISSLALTISDHLVQFWAEDAVKGFLWHGARRPSARLGHRWGALCQGPDVQTSCGNTHRRAKTNHNTQVRKHQQHTESRARA